MQNLYVLKEDVILKRENKAIKLEGSEIKKIPVGAEAFDKVNGTNFSENFKELNIAEAIIGLLVIGAYENGEIDSYQKTYIRKIINEMTSNKSYKEELENNLYKRWMEIDKQFKESFHTDCFFEDMKYFINKAISSINKYANNELKEIFFADLVQITTVNTNNKECKKQFLYLIGKNIGLSQIEINEIINHINPNFMFTDEKNDKYDNFYDKKNYENKKDPYEILGVSRNDDFEIIKQRYKELVKKFHPDYIEGKGLDEEFIKFANEKLKEINWAFLEIKKERGL